MEENKPLISVVVPIFNVEAYLDRCIESIVNQTYKNLEIILVDDGSPDRCGEICDKWADKDNRIKVIHQLNGGLSVARNSGLNIASGDWIGFVDSDDYISPDMYESLMSESHHKDVDVVIGNLIYIDNEGNRIPPSLHWEASEIKSYLAIDTIKPLIEYKFPHSVCLAVIRANALNELRFVENEINEDFFFMGQLLINIYKCKRRIVRIPRYIYYYVYNPKGICAGANKKLEIYKLKHKIQLSQAIYKTDPSNKIFKSLYQWSVVNAIEFMNNFKNSSERRGVNKRSYNLWKKIINKYNLRDFKHINLPLGYKINFLLQKFSPTTYFLISKIRN